jgi:uncharacterized membrane protein
MFLSGLLVLVPLAITIFVLRIIVAALTGFVRPFLAPWRDDVPEHVLVLVAAVITILAIYFAGLIAAHIVGRRMIRLGETILLKVPVIKSVYAASKQIVEAVSETTQAGFQAVVLVEFPRAGSLAIGFVTGTILDPSNRTLYRVFVPTTPNPTSGFLVILPEEEVRFTDISIENGVRMIVSGGVLSPRRYEEIQRPRNAGASGTLDAPVEVPAGDSAQT